MIVSFESRKLLSGGVRRAFRIICVIMLLNNALICLNNPETEPKIVAFINTLAHLESCGTTKMV